MHETIPDVTDSLETLFPSVATQWHPTKNGELTPNRVTPGSVQKVWWKCGEGLDHEWQAALNNRTSNSRRSNKNGCPFCRGLQPSATNSLASKFPEIAQEWHPTKNGGRTPDQVVAGSNKKAWWKCPKGADHEWQAILSNRTSKKSGCPFCRGFKVSPTNSLASKFPGIAEEWHPTKNGGRTPDQVVAGSNKKAWWKCPKGADHEWQATLSNRTWSDRGCPFCAGRQVSVTNSLASSFPEVAAEWHPTRNANLTPEQVVAGSHEKAWWKCPKGADHEWQASLSNRTGNTKLGCPFCRGLHVSVTNSLASSFPEVAAEWHPTRNADLTPDQVVAGSHEKAWWKCPKGADHEWQASLSNRTRDRGCPFCAGRQVSVTNSLASSFPEVAAEWHPTRNANLTPEQVVAGSRKNIWWKCPKGADHEWQASLNSRTGHNRTGCPFCNQGWTLQNIRLFVAGIRQHLDALTPAERYAIFQQSGALGSEGMGLGFVSDLAAGRVPGQEVDRFLSQESRVMPDEAARLQAFAADLIQDIDSDPLATIAVLVEAKDEAELPTIEAKDALAAVDAATGLVSDESAVEFLVASALAKLWKHAYADEGTAIRQAEDFAGGEYSMRVRQAFLAELREANELPLPRGYSFVIEGQLTPPNLMQRHVAAEVKSRGRVGNWSGTGAGKTLSAILASRVIEAGLTLICCPNSVVEGWREKILQVFPDSDVATKNFEPAWASESSQAHPRYLVMNYEQFQQSLSALRVREFLEGYRIDFVVIDELHFTKQRVAENLSRRREILMALLTKAADDNPALHVLGMSATPVINNLQEGRSLVELISGLSHDDLDIRPTIMNCMHLHRALVMLGARWLPDYALEYDQVEVPVDVGSYLDEVRALGHTGSPLKLEQILTRARLPSIRENVRRKTLIYTHYITGIDKQLGDALSGDGWRVGFFTGDDKAGLDDFIDGDLDVLIASSAVSTGVDRLQEVCSHMIINVLPWTAAEFDQLKGRLFRQGQASTKVTLILPMTYANVAGERWSWCEAKMQRLRFKRSIADAAVDGVVPEGHLRTPAQAYQDLMGWLERLESGYLPEQARPKIVVPLPDDLAGTTRRLRRYGDFSEANRRWNTTSSDRLHERLVKNPEEWSHYHTEYRKAREDWAVVPYEDMIQWCGRREGYVIGDFGCGEAELAKAVSSRHTVYSFDHVSINEEVVACDMAHVPLEDSALDVAVFSLSLMGANFSDYLREAVRTLKIDGHLHIYEATSRFSDRDAFVLGLRQLGFDNISVRDRWKFTHIHAIKTDRKSEANAKLRF